MGRQLLSVRVVVASPGDVQSERKRVDAVLDELNAGVAGDRDLHLEAVRWETDSYPGFHPEGPQGLIDPILDIVNADFVIGIFWKRFGTPTLDAGSGTEHEFRVAFDAWTKNRRPRIIVYFNQKPYVPQSRKETDQWGQVLEFRDAFPKEGLWWPYKGANGFEKLLRSHLTHLIRTEYSIPTSAASPVPVTRAGTTQAQVPPALFSSTRFTAQRDATVRTAKVAPRVNTIPALPNTTIGRKTEVEQVAKMLVTGHLVTIFGVGGCGKTRVAIDLANTMKEHFEDGVVYVELAPLASIDTERSLVPSRIATVAGIREEAKRPPTEMLAEHFAGGKYLLILDNCEHVLSSCAEIAAYLISQCPDLRIVATSRALLQIPEERVFPLWPLTIPAPREAADVEELMGSEAVQLFVERARLHSPGYELTESNVGAVADLCRALDGIPLAIELAAGFLDAESVQEIGQGRDELRDLPKAMESGNLRHWDSLSAALKWSYDLLSPAEASVFRALSVFEGGWTERAAAEVFGQADESSALDHLRALSNQSLIVSVANKTGIRFRFLEPIRQFALQQLTAAEKAKYERAHAEYFLRLSEEAAPRLLQADQAEWLDVLQTEADNLRAAIRWALMNNEAETGLRLMAALWRFCDIRGYFAEGRERSRDVLNIPGASAFPSLRSRVLSGAGLLAYRQGDFDAAQRMFDESLTIERGLQNEPGIANALNDLGLVAAMQGQYELARRTYNESVAIVRRLGDRRGEGVGLFNLGRMAFYMGDSEEARRLLLESLDRFEAAGNLRESAFSLNVLGQVAVMTGDVSAALDWTERSIKIRQELSDKKGVADAYRTLGLIRLEMKDYAAAKEILRESLTTTRGVADKQGIADCLDVCAELSSRQGYFADSVAAYAAATELRAKIQYTQPCAYAARRETHLATAKESLGESEYSRWWQEGRTRSLAESMDSALRS